MWSRVQEGEAFSRGQTGGNDRIVIYYLFYGTTLPQIRVGWMDDAGGDVKVCECAQDVYERQGERVAVFNGYALKPAELREPPKVAVGAEVPATATVEAVLPP